MDRSRSRPLGQRRAAGLPRRPERHRRGRADRGPGPGGDRDVLRVADRRRPRRRVAARRAAPGRRRGRPTNAPGHTSTPPSDHVRSERALRAAAVERTAARVTPELAAAFLDGLGESGIELGADQAAAVRGVLDLRRQRRIPRRARRAPARASCSAPSPTPGPTPPSGTASTAGCSGWPPPRSPPRSCQGEGPHRAQHRPVARRAATPRRRPRVRRRRATGDSTAG